MIRAAVAVLAAGLFALAILAIAAETRGLSVTRAEVDGTPVTLYAAEGAAPGPAVLIAHGFAGSQGLMAPFATTLARSGYLAITYDALGHGRNPRPMRGDVTREDGATAALLAELAEIDAFARTHPGSDGRIAVLGHSMASDIVVRHAIATPGVAATVAVSMFSPAVTATAPPNLLVIVGAWEGTLAEEAARVTALAAGVEAEPGVTYGDPAAGTARRYVLAPHVEHVGVLYAATSLGEARDWLGAVFAWPSAGATDGRGPWVLALVAAVMAFAWAAAPGLPRLAAAPAPGRGALSWRAFLAAAFGPALATGLVAPFLPVRPVPVPVADYLAVHFLVYGALGLAALAWLGRLPRRVPPGPLLVATAAIVGFAALALYLPIDRFVTAFLPVPHRLPLMAVLVAGLLPFFLADETLTREAGPGFAYPVAKVAFLASLGIAIAIDLPRLFFLLIILPVVLAFFLLFGLIGRWAYRATGSAWPMALAQALLFGWAIAVTFPVLG